VAVPYSKAMAWGTLPLLLYFAVRRCMQGMNMVRPISFALVTANIINAVGNWLLIYGRLGAPAMGAVGSGWSTAFARIYLAAILVGYLLWYDQKTSHRVATHSDFSRNWRESGGSSPSAFPQRCRLL